MNRIALPVLILAACAACAAGPTEPTAPTSEVRTAVGEATQANWDTGNTAYLTWNGAREGWTTTASGLQYRRVGRASPDGDQPASTDTVRVQYRGTFIDGREFDSSWSRNEPTEFPLNRVIPGWTEGVALMREGERFEFVIPSDIAYGSRWAGGGDLPPNSTLLFTVDLLEVKPAS